MTSVRTDLSGNQMEVVVERRDGTLLLTLNRPTKRNAIDVAMRRQLLKALQEGSSDPTVQVIVITGAGEHFCAGGDVSQMAGHESNALDARERMRFVQGITSTIVNMEKPVIAAVDGVAYGGGFSLMLAADFAIGTVRAKLCASFLKIGLVPDMGSMYLLPRLVGLARAKQLMLTGKAIGGEEARSMGLLFELVEPARLLDAAMEMAHRFERAPTKALGMAKTLMTRSFNLDEQAVAEAEALMQALLLESGYHKDASAKLMNRDALAFVWPE